MPDEDLLLPDLRGEARTALDAADRYVLACRTAVETRLARGADLDAEQHAVHGLAWIATTVEALRALADWADGLAARDAFGTVEGLILQAGFAESLAQLAGGIAMSQGEIVRPADLGPAAVEAARMLAESAPVARLVASAGPATRAALGRALAAGAFGDTGLDDDSLVLMRDQIRRFVEERVAPHAHDWHLEDRLIPIDVVEAMGELGVFGLTIPEAHGGLGLGKLAMCLVSEELSRGYVGVGSLGTRSEIAAELIRLAGTDTQKAKYLPRIASGEILPTAVFTEPDTGSDLAALRTRAARATDTAGRPVWRVTGQKTWTTHGARSDLMTLLVRTDPQQPGYRGLSMLLAEKPRGTDDAPFPAPGMSGGEIRVLGYRGMKEYEIGFDGFEVPADALLGGVEGQGFKQLMQTFESARIQTAARAVGVAQDAMELGLRYATERRQFGRALIDFPRVHGKLAAMAVETMLARQLTWAAARAKDGERRCDVEAGMAKLLAARVAWANADNALQIHGGNGYALEYEISRVLCDARILNIFEGAAEIQAQVIARGLLARKN